MARAARRSTCFSPISCVCSIETTRSRNMRTEPIARRISYVDSTGREDPPGVRLGREDRATMRRTGRETGSQPFPHEPDHRRGEGARIAGRHEEAAPAVLDDPEKPVHRRADYGPREREGVSGDSRTRGVAVGAHDGVARGEPGSALVLGEVTQLETNPSRRPRWKIPSLAPGLAGEDQLCFGDGPSHVGERLELDIPTLVGPQEPAEKEERRVCRHSEPGTGRSSIRDHHPRLGGMRNHLHGRIGAYRNDLSRAPFVLNDESIRPSKDRMRQHALQRVSLVVVDVVAEKELRDSATRAGKAREKEKNVRSEERGPPRNDDERGAGRQGFLRKRQERKRADSIENRPDLTQVSRKPLFPFIERILFSILRSGIEKARIHPAKRENRGLHAELFHRARESMRLIRDTAAPGGQGSDERDTGPHGASRRKAFRYSPSGQSI